MNNYSELNIFLEEQTEWAGRTSCFDISLLRCWVQFERFLTEKFIHYSTCPVVGDDIRKLKFTDRQHLKSFLKGEKTYIDYVSKIESLSQHIFLEDKNPFHICLFDSHYAKSFRNIRVIRNHIAHESEESKKKYINSIFDGNVQKYIAPNEYLLKWTKDRSRTYYSQYIEDIRNMAQYIENMELSDSSSEDRL